MTLFIIFIYLRVSSINDIVYNINSFIHSDMFMLYLVSLIMILLIILMVSPIVILFILIVSLLMIFGCQQLFLRTPFIFFLKMNCSEKKTCMVQKVGHWGSLCCYILPGPLLACVCYEITMSISTFTMFNLSYN